MDASEFLGLRATHNPMRWVLDVVPGICTDDQFLFGGCGLGAAIEELGVILRATARRNKRKKPGTFELLNDPELLEYSLT